MKQRVVTRTPCRRQVRAVSAAMPMLSINPTSGVDLDNAGEFLRRWDG
jgi:hypothetical protein